MKSSIWQRVGIGAALLSILLLTFVALLAATQHDGFDRQFIVAVINLLPAALVAAALATAVHNARLGGLLFLLLAAASCFVLTPDSKILSFIVLAAPLLVAGGAFLATAFLTTPRANKKRR